MCGIAPHLSKPKMIKLSSSPDSHGQTRNTNTTEVELFKQPPETAAAAAPLRGDRSSLLRKGWKERHCQELSSQTLLLQRQEEHPGPKPPLGDLLCPRPRCVSYFPGKNFFSVWWWNCLRQGRMLEGQHGREKANMHSQKMYLRQTSSWNLIMEGSFFFPLKKKSRIQNTPCCPTSIKKTIATYLYLSDLVSPIAWV